MQTPAHSFMAQTDSAPRYHFLFFIWGPITTNKFGLSCIVQGSCEHMTRYGKGGCWDRNDASNFDWTSLQIQ